MIHCFPSATFSILMWTGSHYSLFIMTICKFKWSFYKDWQTFLLTKHKNSLRDNKLPIQHIQGDYDTNAIVNFTRGMSHAIELHVNKRVCHVGSTTIKVEMAVFWYKWVLIGNKELSLTGLTSSLKCDGKCSHKLWDFQER